MVLVNLQNMRRIFIFGSFILGSFILIRGPTLHKPIALRITSYSPNYIKGVLMHSARVARNARYTPLLHESYAQRKIYHTQ